MVKFVDALSHRGLALACRLHASQAGTIAPGVAFSLTGLGLAIIACLLFLDAGFNVRSSTFGADLLRAIRY